MEIDPEIKSEIEKLDAEIVKSPCDPSLYVKRGKLYNGAGIMDRALNDFLKAGELDPSDDEVRQYINMIREIFEFRSLDYYNP